MTKKEHIEDLERSINECKEMGEDLNESDFGFSGEPSGILMSANEAQSIVNLLKQLPDSVE